MKRIERRSFPAGRKQSKEASTGLNKNNVAGTNLATFSYLRTVLTADSLKLIFNFILIFFRYLSADDPVDHSVTGVTVNLLEVVFDIFLNLFIFKILIRENS